MAEITKSVTVTGRVQGVGYRAWTDETARGLGLSGWVRNEADGSVRAVVSGHADAVAKMLEAMEEGPRWARVATVRAEASDPPDQIGFDVLA